jgi:hypothetical protein
VLAVLGGALWEGSESRAGGRPFSSQERTAPNDCLAEHLGATRRSCRRLVGRTTHPALLRADLLVSTFAELSTVNFDPLAPRARLSFSDAYRASRMPLVCPDPAHKLDSTMPSKSP